MNKKMIAALIAGALSGQVAMAQDRMGEAKPVAKPKANKMKTSEKKKNEKGAPEKMAEKAKPGCASGNGCHSPEMMEQSKPANPTPQ